MNRYLFITGNKGKFDEASKIIPELEQKDIDLPEIQSLDSKEIINAKLTEARKHVKGNLIVEDVSLNFECLNGLPGPLIKWFVKVLDNDGMFDLVDKYKNYNAEAKVILGVAFENGNIEYFEGNAKGKIVSPRGENGFAWDKIFEQEGMNKTLAEMTLEEKNEISTRRMAFQKLKDFLS